MLWLAQLLLFAPLSLRPVPYPRLSFKSPTAALLDNSSISHTTPNSQSISCGQLPRSPWPRGSRSTLPVSSLQLCMAWLFTTRPWPRLERQSMACSSILDILRCMYNLDVDAQALREASLWLLLIRHIILLDIVMGWRRSWWMVYKMGVHRHKILDMLTPWISLRSKTNLVNKRSQIIK